VRLAPTMDTRAPYALAVILVAGVCAMTARSEHPTSPLVATGAFVARAPEAPIEARPLHAVISTGDVTSTRLEAVDDRGRPLAGVRVRVDGRSIAPTDQSGLAILDGFGDAMVELFGTGYHHRERLSLAGQVRVVLERTATIRGRIVGAAAGSDAIVVRAFAESAAEPAALTAASKDGSFVLEEVPPGLLRLTIAGPGSSGHTRTLEIRPGERRNDVLIVAEPGYTIDGTASIGGRPAAGAAVSWAPGEYAPVDASGRFAIHGLTSGHYPLRIAVAVDGAWMTSSSGGIDVEVADADTHVDLIAEDLFPVLVDVVGEDGSGVSGVAVSYERAGSTGTTRVERTTDARGRAHFGGIPRGRLRGITTSIPWTTPIAVEVPPLDPARIEVAATGQVLGSLSWSGGEAVREVPCSLRDDRDRIAVASTDRYGHFSFPPIPMGRYLMQCFAHGTSVLALERGAATTAHGVLVQVMAGRSTRISARLEASLPAVRGIVTRAGKPAAGVEVALYAEGQSEGLALGRTLSAQDGSFVLEASATMSRFDVVAHGPMGWSLHRGVSADRGPIALELAAPGRIEAAIPGRHSAYLWRRSVQVASARDGEHPGTVAFDGLAPGRYRITVDAEQSGQEIEVEAGKTVNVDLRAQTQPPR